jgi:Flp pilus assembly protein TadG
MRSTRLKRRGRRGSYFIEFSLAFWPLFVLMLGIIDFSLPIFLRSAFTKATREGVRYGTTFQTVTGKNHTDSIKAIVLMNSAGFLRDPTDLNKIEVKFYNPTTFVEVTSGTKNADGNVIEVSIFNYTWNWIVPLWGTASPLTYNIRSADRLESLPRGATPQRPVRNAHESQYCSLSNQSTFALGRPAWQRHP